MTQTDKGFRIFAIFVVATLVAVALVNLYQAKMSGPSARTISYSQFLDDVEQSKVSSVTLVGQEMRGLLIDQTIFKVYAPNDPDLIKILRQKGVAISAKTPADNGPSFTPLTALLPILLLVGVAIFFMRRMPGIGPRASLGRSKAKLLAPTEHRVTFKDVAGVDEAKDSLQEIVDFLRAPEKFERLGGKIPRGVLLVGPPGSGKTLLARAIAGEANVPFLTISGSDFVEMFVGIGAARVRALFEQASKNAPCIIFMDEIDAVGRRRGAGVGGGNDEREQTLNQLLVEMDGFVANPGVILIAATNRPDVLDPALLRPGRFDREIVVHNPDILGREHILAVHVRAVPLASDVILTELARTTPGFSGADLMNLVNEAALLAARRDKSNVGMLEFEAAKAMVMMGAERRTHVMSEEEKRLTAYREGGRAIIALCVPCADPIHTVTIITRGRSSGMVQQLSADDQDVVTLEQVNSRLTVLLGGRASEELIFGRKKITSSTAADIEEATKLARTMVTRWGFSETLGAVAYEENQEEVFLGHSMSRQQSMSNETAHTVAVEVRRLIDAALAEGRKILEVHRADLDAVAQALMQRETLAPADLEAVLAGTAARIA